MLRHQITSTGKEYDFSALQRAVDEALRTHERALIVDLDAVGFLDAAVIRELIRGLRRLRERGGNMHVASTRPTVLLSLKTLALDRVFRCA